MQKCIYCGRDSLRFDVRFLELSVAFHSYIITSPRYPRIVRPGRTVFFMMGVSHKMESMGSFMGRSLNIWKKQLTVFDDDFAHDSPRRRANVITPWTEYWPWRMLHRVYPICFTCLEKDFTVASVLINDKNKKTKGTSKNLEQCPDRYKELFTDLQLVYDSITHYYEYSELGDIRLLNRLRLMTIMEGMNV